MTSKKPHSIFNKVKKRESTKPRHKKWLVFILLLPIFIVAYLISSQPSSDTIVTPIVAPPTVAEQNVAARSADLSIEETSGNNNAMDGNESKIEIPSSKAIINAPLPETNSLAKEEIDRLADERQRLKEQEKLVAEQVEMTKSLTEMKAEQIELLEQQIAELEAENAAE